MHFKCAVTLQTWLQNPPSRNGESELNLLRNQSRNPKEIKTLPSLFSDFISPRFQNRQQGYNILRRTGLINPPAFSQPC